MTDFWTNKKVLVTGGSGLIGTPMYERLRGAGAQVRNFDMSKKNDVCQFSEVHAAMYGMDVVIHLAAISHVENSRRKRLETFETNVRGTWNVLEAAHLCDVRSVVTAASNHVYGVQHKGYVHESEQPTTLESASLNQMDTYSVTKIMADYATRAYWHNYRLPTASVRNTNCYGPRDPHHDHLIPGTILSCLRGETPVIRGKGKTEKGYLYVDDVVDAYLLLAEKIYTGDAAPGEAWNVGASPASVRVIVDFIMAFMGMPGEPEVLGADDDQPNENLDSCKMHRLGWQPKHSFPEGLEKTVEWFRQEQRVAQAAS